LRYKFDYPPLLAPGRHYMTLAQLERMCVHSFNYRPSREALFVNLERFVQDFLLAKLPCEIWVDGSFLTEKPDPQDVDVVAILDAEVAEALTPAQRVLVDTANEPDYLPGIDSFVDTLYPHGHPMIVDDDRTWGEQYGLENGDQWLKGFAVLRLWETDVGLRIRS
jgi:hypothetical protein